MRDLFGISGGLLAALWALTVEPWSPTWWMAVLLAGALFLVSGADLVSRYAIQRWGSRLMANYFLIAASMCAVGVAISLLGWALLRGAKAPEVEVSGSPYFYFNIDILDPTNLTAANPGQIVNEQDVPFNNVTTWFSPSNAKRKPDPPNGPYWSLRDLKVPDWTPLHKGIFRTGISVPPGDYCVEYNAIRDGKSFGFVERLQIIPYEGRLIQLIDVWGNDNKKIWSSERPKKFQDSPVPWLS